ncbi:unnamed protein product [Ectocarpus sp. 6 AP-2014]
MYCRSTQHQFLTEVGIATEDDPCMINREKGRFDILLKCRRLQVYLKARLCTKRFVTTVCGIDVRYHTPCTDFSTAPRRRGCIHETIRFRKAISRRDGPNSRHLRLRHYLSCGETEL